MIGALYLFLTLAFGLKTMQPILCERDKSTNNVVSFRSYFENIEIYATYFSKRNYTVIFGYNDTATKLVQIEKECPPKYSKQDFELNYLFPLTPKMTSQPKIIISALVKFFLPILLATILFRYKRFFKFITRNLKISIYSANNGIITGNISISRSEIAKIIEEGVIIRATQEKEGECVVKRFAHMPINNEVHAIFEINQPFNTPEKGYSEIKYNGVLQKDEDFDRHVISGRVVQRDKNPYFEFSDQDTYFKFYPGPVLPFGMHCMQIGGIGCICSDIVAEMFSIIQENDSDQIKKCMIHLIRKTDLLGVAIYVQYKEVFKKIEQHLLDPEIEKSIQTIIKNEIETQIFNCGFYALSIDKYRVIASKVTIGSYSFYTMIFCTSNAYIVREYEKCMFSIAVYTLPVLASFLVPSVISKKHLLDKMMKKSLFFKSTDFTVGAEMPYVPPCDKPMFIFENKDCEIISVFRKDDCAFGSIYPLDIEQRTIQIYKLLKIKFVDTYDELDEEGQMALNTRRKVLVRNDSMYLYGLLDDSPYKCYLIPLTYHQDYILDNIILEDKDDMQSFAVWLIEYETGNIRWSMLNEKSNKQLAESHLTGLQLLCSCCDPNDVASLENSIKSLNSYPVTMILDLRLKLGTDEYEWFLVMLMRHCEQYFSVLAINIDEQKKRIALLKEIDDTLSLGIHYANVVLWKFENSISPLKFKTIEPTNSGIITFNWATIIHNVAYEYRELCENILMEAFETGKAFHYEVPIFYNEMRWYSVRGVGSTTPGEIIGVDVDITEMKEMEEEAQYQKQKAEDAANAKTKFLANMSHEVRTPLNGICGLLEVLEGTQLNDEQLEMISCMRESFHKLLELLNDTLDLAKIEQNKMDPLNVQFCPVDEINDVVLPIKSKVPIYHFVAPNTPVFCIGDPHCFSRIIMNLVSNAVKFTEKGYVSIEVEATEELLIVSISDTGIGISNDDKQRIFDIFSQGDNSITRPFGGIGVGLTLVYKMLELINGKMEWKSEVGVGSRFTISIPFEQTYVPYIPATIKSKNLQLLVLIDDDKTKHELARHCEYCGISIIYKIEDVTNRISSIVFTEKDKKEALKLNDKYDCFLYMLSNNKNEAKIDGVEIIKHPIPVSEIRNIFYAALWSKKNPATVVMDSFPDVRILAADDNQTNQLVLQKIFEKFKCKFTIVNDGIETLAVLKDGQYDMIFLDNYMPGLSGPETAQRIRKTEGYEEIPIIAMTASTIQKDEEECLASGMNLFLTKPTTMRKISEAISHALNIGSIHRSKLIVS